VGRRDHRREGELRRLYVEHVGAVYGFLAYAVGRQVAEDLTATTFERAIRHWERYDAARASERTWLLTIARNALTDHFRRQSHRTAQSLEASPLLLDTLADSDDPLARALADHAFTTLLADLPEREREILALRYGGDLSAREIADLMDLSEANVHQIVSRTLKKLRALVSPDDSPTHADPPMPG
jgi:RNA polymerase sigma-70 factor (ECF subfamily)